MDRDRIGEANRATALVLTVCLVLGLLCLCLSCTTSRRTELQAHAVNHAADSLHVVATGSGGTQFGATWQSVVLGMDSTAIEVEVQEVVYDTQRTDSDGTHPVAAVKNTKIRGSRSGTRREESGCDIVQADSVSVAYIADSVSQTASQSDVATTTTKRKAAAAWKVYVVAIALCIILIISKSHGTQGERN